MITTGLVAVVVAGSSRGQGQRSGVKGQVEGKGQVEVRGHSEVRGQPEVRGQVEVRGESWGQV